MEQNLVPFERIEEIRGRRFLLKVETSASPADYEKYERLREAIWRFPEDHMASARNLMCENFVHDGSSLFLAAYAEAESGGFVEDDRLLAGFAYGFVGVKDKILAFRSPENLRFYAQYTGVRPDFEGSGLGVRLKEFQRGILTGRWGIFEVVCTYDPLTGANAYRNIHRFGMSVEDYLVSTYGAFGGRLNRTDVPTDRFFTSWDLRRPIEPSSSGGRVLPGEASRILRVETVPVAGRSEPLPLEVVAGVDLDHPGPACLVQIPADFYLMLRETDVDAPDVRRIPVDWRLATRRAFQGLFAQGYRVVDFLKITGDRPESYYLLKKE
jgi:predicted GNAT superfamily acetyltransferase